MGGNRRDGGREDSGVFAWLGLRLRLLEGNGEDGGVVVVGTAVAVVVVMGPLFVLG